MDWFFMHFCCIVNYQYCREIHCYYPDFGLEKLKILFSQKIYPSINVQNHPISILFCFEGVQTQKECKHNHCVPLAFKK